MLNQSKMIFVLMFIVLTPLFAIRDFNLSIKGGYVSASVNGSDATVQSGVTLSPLDSFKVGIGFEIGFLKFIALQPEFTFLQKGYNLRGIANQTLTINYIEVPVWLKFRLGGFYVGPGVYFALNIGATASVNNTADVGNIISAIDVSTFDFGTGAIIGYQFKLGKKISLFIEISSLIGFIANGSLAGQTEAQIFNNETYIGTGIALELANKKKQKAK